MFPTLFLSHGSPMHAQDAGAAGRAWAQVAAAMPTPKAIVMVSAHWETSSPAVTTTATPATIHDFSGFPDALYKIRYAAPGAVAAASKVADHLHDAGLTVVRDVERGLDHGAWVPLRNMYPKADVPVMQLSVQTGLGARHHYRLGEALRPLRDETLIIASGHVTHNLREAMLGMHGRPVEGAQASAQRFGDWLFARLAANDHEALIDYRRRSADGVRAHPTEEHFSPLFVALGAVPNFKSMRLYQGLEWDTLVMDAYRFD